jgi:copper resistance protein C
VRHPRTARSARAAAVAAALAVGVGSLLGVVGAAPASAHASLVRSSPADQSSLATAPTTVSLTFDENIRMPSVIIVTDARGASVAQGETSVLDNTASQGVRPGTSGDYAVVYRVVSADGHPVAGRLTFGVGPGYSGSTLRSSDQVATVGHQHDGSAEGASNAVVGMIASLALAAGVGLLTIRRWAPNLWSNKS